MTMHEPNPDVRPTGAEATEFLDAPPDPDAPDDDDDGFVDPRERPSGSPPA